MFFVSFDHLYFDLVKQPSLVPAYVHFNHFIDLTVYSYTNAYNLASSGLL